MSDETFEQKYHFKKEQVFEVELIFKNLDSAVQELNSSFSKIGTQYNKITAEINKLYTLDKSSNKYSSSAKQVQQTFKGLADIQKQLVQKVSGISKHFQSWTTGMEELNNHEVSYLKLKKSYDHYNIKLAKLRQQNSNKQSKNLPISVKETARLKRNEVKQATAKTAYNTHTQMSFKIMEKIFNKRFDLSNPYLCELVTLLEEFFERSGGKLKNISDLKAIFEKDGKNTLSKEQISKAEKEVISKTSLDGDTKNKNKKKTVGEMLQEKAQQEIDESRIPQVSQAAANILSTSRRRKSVELFDEDGFTQQQRAKEERKLQEIKRKEEFEIKKEIQASSSEYEYQPQQQQQSMQQSQLELQQTQQLQSQYQQPQSQEPAQTPELLKLQKELEEMKLKNQLAQQQLIYQSQSQMNNQSQQFQPQASTLQQSQNMRQSSINNNSPPVPALQQSQSVGFNSTGYNANNFGSSGYNNINNNQTNTNNTNNFNSTWDNNQYQSQQKQPQQQKNDDFSSFDFSGFQQQQASTNQNNNNNNNYGQQSTLYNNNQSQSQAQSQLFSGNAPQNTQFNNQNPQQQQGLDIIQTNTVYLNQNDQNNNNPYQQQSQQQQSQNNNYGDFGNFNPPGQTQYTPYPNQQQQQQQQQNNYNNTNTNPPQQQAQPIANPNNPFLNDLI